MLLGGLNKGEMIMSTDTDSAFSENNLYFPASLCKEVIFNGKVIQSKTSQP